MMSDPPVLSILAIYSAATATMAPRQPMPSASINDTAIYRMAVSLPLYPRPESFRGQQCTRGAFAAANDGEEGSGGVVADIAKLSVGREEYYTRELATDHEQYLSGHGESPGRWYGAGATSLGLEGEASPAG